MSEFLELDKRSREIFKNLVEGYLASGQPVGSRSLSKGLSEQISPATVRNVMSDLEALGLLGARHISAGRAPTELGLRFFVDGILEMQTLSPDDEARIRAAIASNMAGDASSESIYERSCNMLADIARSASLIVTKKLDARVKHVEFVMLSREQALVILVSEDGKVDNRIFTPPAGLTSAELARASNFINARINGQSIRELKADVEEAIKEQRNEVDTLTAELLATGTIAMIGEGGASQFVVRGRSHLMGSRQDEEELETLKSLMDDLETKRDLVELVDLIEDAEAVQVFIGSENKLFSLKSSSLVISPYMSGEGEILGAVGVIGPTRLNYARIVPLVSYTAGLIGNMIEGNNP